MVSQRVAAVVLAVLAPLVLTSCQDSPDGKDSTDSKEPKSAADRLEESLLELPGLASVDVPFDDASGEQDGQSQLRLDDDVSESELVTVVMRVPQVVADADLAGSGVTAMYLDDDQVELMLRGADEASARRHARRALDAHERLAGLELLVGTAELGVSTHGDAESVSEVIEMVADDPTMSRWKGWKVDGETPDTGSFVGTEGRLTHDLARQWRAVNESIVPTGRIRSLGLDEEGLRVEVDLDGWGDPYDMTPQSAPALVAMVKAQVAVLAERPPGHYAVVLVRGETAAHIIDVEEGGTNPDTPWTWAAQSWLAEARADVRRRQQPV